jgi:prepilin-type N-terminal cleavage/methylation domain-containing protein
MKHPVLKFFNGRITRSACGGTWRTKHWPHSMAPTSRRARNGFTLIELLVVIAIIAILAALLLPSLGRAKSKAQSTACLNQTRQLQLCWQMYSDDNGDVMPPNKWAGDATGATSLSGSWIVGDTRVDRTFTNVENGILFRYNRSVAIYHCPSDTSVVSSKPALLRTRSYSLNAWLNGMEWPDRAPSRFVKVNQLSKPGPSSVFAFLDEEEHTIEDGHFAIDRLGVNSWENMAADRHAQGCILSYADGHGARSGWRWPKKLSAAVYAKPVANPQDLADLQSLQARLPTQ